MASALMESTEGWGGGGIGISEMPVKIFRIYKEDSGLEWSQESEEVKAVDP